MARARKKINLTLLNDQIDEAQKNVIRTKKKYDEAIRTLKELLDKRKEIQSQELMEAIVKSRRSYDDILRYIQSDPEE